MQNRRTDRISGVVFALVIIGSVLAGLAGCRRDRDVDDGHKIVVDTPAQCPQGGDGKYHCSVNIHVSTSPTQCTVNNPDVSFPSQDGDVTWTTDANAAALQPVVKFTSRLDPFTSATPQNRTIPIGTAGMNSGTEQVACPASDCAFAYTVTVAGTACTPASGSYIGIHVTGSNE